MLAGLAWSSRRVRHGLVLYKVGIMNCTRVWYDENSMSLERYRRGNRNVGASEKLLTTI